jgi:serine/threonine protein kinase
MCKVWALAPSVPSDSTLILFRREVSRLAAVRGRDNIQQILCFTELPNTYMIKAFEYTLADGLIDPSNKVLDSSRTKKSLAIGIATGLQTLHDLQIIHNRLSPKSIVIAFTNGDLKRPIPRIGDFSASMLGKAMVPESEFGVYVAMQNRYLAPEILANLDSDYAAMVPHCSTQSDIYSYGMTLYEIVFRQCPFAEFPDEEDIKSRVVQGMSLVFPRNVPVKVGVFEKMVIWSSAHHFKNRPQSIGVIKELLEGIVMQSVPQ